MLAQELLCRTPILYFMKMEQKVWLQILDHKRTEETLSMKGVFTLKRITKEDGRRLQ
jgi:hypothetical protein